MNSFRKNIHIQLTIILSILYLIYILKLLFQWYFIILDQLLFAHIMNSFSKFYFITQIHELLLQAGIPAQGFSGHSIHKGAAVSASARGISKDDIKLMGRWKSDAVLTYSNETTISESNQKLLPLNKQLQNPSAARSSLAPASFSISSNTSNAFW